jgi:hypothetical protein
VDDLVYVGAHTADLRERFPEDMKDHEVFIAFTGTKKVKQGMMKLFRVLDVGADPDSPPY